MIYKILEKNVTTTLENKEFIREPGNKYDVRYIKDDGSINLDNLIEDTINWIYDEDYYHIDDYFKLITNDHIFDLGGFWSMLLSGTNIENFELTRYGNLLLGYVLYNGVMKKHYGW